LPRRASRAPRDRSGHPLDDLDGHRCGFRDRLDQFGRQSRRLLRTDDGGWAKDYTGSFAAGLYTFAGFALMSAIVSAPWLRIPNPLRQQMAGVPAE